MKNEKIKELIGKPKSSGLKGVLKNSRYYKVISRIQEFVHFQIPAQTFNTALAATPAELREDFFRGTNYERVVIFLLSNGCEWALKGAHGCTMCGHIARQTRKEQPISADDYIQQFRNEFEGVDFKKYPLLSIFINGSFINDNEIPAKAQIEILRMVNTNQDIKMLVIETRPEFVTEDKIKIIKECIPHKYVELAVGLEIKSDLYRTLCLNKGFSLKTFDAAARIITRYLHLRTYVLLKPPFLTEKESIDQAVATIEHAFEAGSATVSLEGCTVQDFTLVKYCYDRGLYRPPWLWSILEAVKRTGTKGQVVIGLFEFYPSPGIVPYNCEECSDRVMEVIRHYNRTLDVSIFDGLTCRCREKWQGILETKPIPFEERLIKLLQVSTNL